VITGAAVVVPVRDEAARLGACLTAVGVAAARVRLRLAGGVRVVVVLDRCTDGSASVAAAHPGVEVVTSRAGRAGAARRRGAAHVLATTPLPPGRLWLAGTDADTRVPPHWLEHQLELAAAGADLVLGTVRPDPAELPGEVLSAWSDGYRDVDGHPHVHGASLGVRGDAYLAAGGFAPVAAHEDVRLVDAAQRAGARVVRTAGCPVVTSGRTRGRAPEGFAAFLRDLRRGVGAVPDDETVVPQAGPGGDRMGRQPAGVTEVLHGDVGGERHDVRDQAAVTAPPH
jgi:hypothetical protein